MLTLSLNVINGYMGEFSCSHPGFMALGAYAASVFTVVLFVNDKLFGAAAPAAGARALPLSHRPDRWAGVVAALGALVVAIPSFRTRGDYLAIISLAFMFIVKSLIENLELVGGPRGLSSQPDWATLPTVFVWTVAVHLDHQQLCALHPGQGAERGARRRDGGRCHDASTPAAPR